MLNHYGREFVEDPRLNAFHRLYIRVFGVPISGMRIRLRRILPRIRGEYDSIIDLGCGKGVFTFELARRFPKADVVGIDTDQEQVEADRTIADRYRHKNVRFEEENILEMNYAEQFDLAVSVDNLEHIEDDVAAMKRIWTALKPGGKFFCHVPNRERIWVIAGRSLNFDVPGHARPGYTAEELRTKLEQAGFEVAELAPTYGYLETVTNNLSYLITGAAQKNQLFYALAFPVLNALAWVGSFQKGHPLGAAMMAIAHKPQADALTPHQAVQR